ncbi:MAG: multicopper oxidase domain-containing protein, partial [Candidatus Rokubacteria bacterium]|nr:multicopper oxidase domain-containing protein [Candidatus Rokubacteria bacterium]
MRAPRFPARTVLTLLAIAAVVSLPGRPEGQEKSVRSPDPYAYLTAGALKAIRPLPDTVRIRPTGRTREFTLEIRPGAWEPVKGVKAEAITINGTVPGPLIRAREGDTVRVTVKNNLA